MSKSNQEYWFERMEQLATQNIAIGDASSKELQKYYNRTLSEVQQSIELYTARYGEDNIIQFYDLLHEADDKQLKMLWEDWGAFVKEHPEYAGLQSVRQNHYKYTRLDALEDDINLKLAKLRAEEERLTGNCLSKTVQHTHTSALEMLKGIDINTKNIIGLSDDMIKEFMNIKWTQDENFSERIWANNDKLVNYVHTTIKEGVIRGASYPEMAKLLELKFNTGLKNANRLVHTESAFMQEEVIFKQYEQAGVEEYEYLSLIDSKTSQVCTALNGKKFKLKDAKVGLNRAPMHPWCRSTSIPVVPGDNSLASNNESAIMEAEKDSERSYFEAANGNKKIIESPKLPFRGESNSAIDRTNNGKIHQRRYYDDVGLPKLDVDYTNHGNSKAHPIVPHSHDWLRGTRCKWRKMSEIEKEFNEKAGDE